MRTWVHIKPKEVRCLQEKPKLDSAVVFSTALPLPSWTITFITKTSISGSQLAFPCHNCTPCFIHIWKSLFSSKTCMFPSFLLVFLLLIPCLSPGTKALVNPCFWQRNDTLLNSIWSCSTSDLISRLRLVPAHGSLQGRENELGRKLDAEVGWHFEHEH